MRRQPWAVHVCVVGLHVVAQLMPHTVPLHVAVKPAGCGQARQELGPQFAVLVLDTQAPPQLWKPELHVEVHVCVVVLQVAVVFAPLVPQSTLVQQAVLATQGPPDVQLLTQVVLHVWVVKLHTGVAFEAAGQSPLMQQPLMQAPPVIQVLKPDAHV